MRNESMRNEAGREWKAQQQAWQIKTSAAQQEEASARISLL